MLWTFSEQDVQKTLTQVAMQVCDHALLMYSYPLAMKGGWERGLAQAYDNSLIVLNSADLNFAPFEIENLLIFPIRSSKYSASGRMVFFRYLGGWCFSGIWPMASRCPYRAVTGRKKQR